MKLNELSDMIKESLSGMKSLLEKETVTGAPVALDDGSVIIPVNKVSIGFVSGAGEISAKPKLKSDEVPLGGLGGGVTVTPIGFFVLKDGDPIMIKTQGDIGDKWLDILHSVIKRTKD